MRYLSLFSGIEAASVAFGPLGWTPAAFAEIDKFGSAVLAHHYPGTPNLGDVSKIDAPTVAGLGHIDLVVGGSPCQDFSLAGLRQGLAAPRGNLTLEFLRVVDLVRPEWVLWENVPGVISVDEGRTFPKILDAFGELGYVFDVDVLDAVAFGVPQRRRRVFIVAHDVAAGRRKGSRMFRNAVRSAFADAALAAAASFPPFAGARRAMAGTGAARKAFRPFEVGEGDFPNLRALWAEGVGSEPPAEIDLLLPAIGGEAADESRAFALAAIPLALAAAPDDTEWLDARSSGSAALEAYLNHARQADAPLFGGLDGHPDWGRFALAAARALRDLEDRLGAEAREPEVPPDREGLPGYFEESEGEEACSPTLLASGAGTERSAGRLGSEPDFVVPFVDDGAPIYIESGVASALTQHTASGADDGHAQAGWLVAIPDDDVAHTLAAEGADASEDGTCRGVPLLPLFGPLEDAWQCHGSNVGPLGVLRAGNGNESGGVPFVAIADEASPLTTRRYADGLGEESRLVVEGGDIMAIAFSCKDDGRDAVVGIAPTLRAMEFAGSHANGGGQLAVAFAERGVGTRRAVAVWRFTPCECEGLQGFPRDYTRVPNYRRKVRASDKDVREAAIENGMTAEEMHADIARYYGVTPEELATAGVTPDGVRYRALGNSFAVPVVRWIGSRIDAIAAWTPEAWLRRLSATAA